MKIININVQDINVCCLTPTDSCELSPFCANHVTNVGHAHSLYGIQPKFDNLNLHTKTVNCFSDESVGGDHVFGIALTLNTIKHQLEFDFD